jgi:hypothetical protein
MSAGGEVDVKGGPLPERLQAGAALREQPLLVALNLGRAGQHLLSRPTAVIHSIGVDRRGPQPEG